jgi:predicted RND superfamily exporter protein
MLAGLTIVAVGIYSCIIPGIMTGGMLVLLGVWNISTGSIGIYRIVNPIARAIGKTPEKAAEISHSVKKIQETVLILHLATIIFGINLLIPDLIPWMIVLGILLVLGILFMVLAYLLNEMPEYADEG